MCQLLCACSTDKADTVTATVKGAESAPATAEGITEAETDFDESGLPMSDETESDVETTAGYKSVIQMNYLSMNIDNIMQESIGMPYGCEVVSLSMALEYYGYSIDPRFLFFGFMPHGAYGEANPYYEYVGDPTDITGYGCYAPCVVETANKYLEKEGSSRRARDVSGASMYELLGYVWNGIPVIIWGTLDMEPTSEVIDSWYFNGERIKWYNLSHCVLICGVQDDSFIVCDPMKGKVTYPIKDVETANTLIYSQAVVIY